MVADTRTLGQVLWRESYEPYGRTRRNPVGNLYYTGYTGHLKDFGSGLIYMQARYYDPLIGRFYSTDPIGYQDQLNLYAYVANDPVNKVDPNGEGSVAIDRFVARAAFAGGVSQADSPAPGPGDVAAAVILVGSVAALGYDTLKAEAAKPDAHDPRPVTDGEKKTLAEAGKAPDKGDRTKAGRAAEKHGSRPGSAFPPTSGDAESVNEQGQKTLEGILGAEGSTVEVDDRGRTTVTAPDGRGARFNPDGSMQGFREPPPPPDDFPK